MIQAQLHRMQRSPIVETGKIGDRSVAEGFGEHRHQGQEQEQAKKSQHHSDEDPAQPGRLGEMRLDVGTHDCASRLAIQRCRRLITSSITKEKTSITTAMAVA